MGELRALLWSDVDFAKDEIAVTRSWDEKCGAVLPKSKAGTRRVPLVPTLRRILLEHRMAAGHADAAAFVFASPRSRHAPFTPSAVRRRAETAWKTANRKRLEEAVERAWKAARLAPEYETEWKAANEARVEKEVDLLVPIGLHECRHTFVSLMAAAGVPLEVIGDLVGHSSTYMVDRYRHLIEGQAADAALRFDAYLATPRATPQVR
jgi:integrase